MLFSVNEVVDFKETGISMTDRLIIVPFNATFTDEEGNRDINIVEKLCQPLPLQIIATRAIFEFCKVLENGKFTIPQSVQAETEKYFMECNNALKFCKLYPIDNFIVKRQYYFEYKTWCEENNIQPVGDSQFGKVVISFGYKSDKRSFKGKKYTLYVNPEFDTEKCYSFYRAFEQNKELSFITRNMTFEEYLGKLIFLKELNELERVEIEKLKKFEPEILLDNT